MILVTAYAAGLLTLINPCVLPILPIVLASATQAGRAGPAYLALGMGVSFVILGVTVTAFGHLVGLTADGLAQISAVVMIAFGLLLVTPRWSGAFSTATAGLAARADTSMNNLDSSMPAHQFLGGALLGAVWSPCIGPTLGSAIALAAQGESLALATAIMTSFALGVGTIILALAYGAQGLFRRHQTLFQQAAMWSRPILGATFIVIGVGLFFRVHHALEGWALQSLPPWLIDLSVSL